MAKKKVDMLLCESIITVLFISILILSNIVMATSFQSDYFKNQGLIILIDLVVMLLGIFRIRIFFNDVEE